MDVLMIILGIVFIVVMLIAVVALWTDHGSKPLADYELYGMSSDDYERTIYDGMTAEEYFKNHRGKNNKKNV